MEKIHLLQDVWMKLGYRLFVYKDINGEHIEHLKVAMNTLIVVVSMFGCWAFAGSFTIHF
jgi:hypothetical protein